MSTPDPVPDAARREVDRIRSRWSRLPLEKAGRVAPLLADVVADLGGRSASALGHGEAGPRQVPVAALPDALGVVVHDCFVAGVAADVQARLTQVRRALP